MKIWQTQKSQALDPIIENFTIGADRECDAQLLKFDALASLAHAATLLKAKFLSQSEFRKIQKVLQTVSQKPTLISLQNFEDGHSALEDFLSKKLGDLGAKIHLGRSRNDQAATALRLFGKSKLLKIQAQILAVSLNFLELAEKFADLPCPGYTHTRPAMLTSVGHFFAAFAESLGRDFCLLTAVQQAFDSCPLGAAAGFGTTLPLDRNYTAKLLGFPKPENNTLTTQLSRGSFEANVSSALANLFLPLSRFANDLIYFSAPEFDFFELNAKIATGSSIMPQKSNPDALEILRGSAGSLLGKTTEIFSLTQSRSAGYTRDLQLTKKPFLESLTLAENSLTALPVLLKNLKVNKAKCILSASQPEIFAAEKANQLVAKKQLSFRAAYREVKQNLAELKGQDSQTALKLLKITGSAGNLNLAPTKKFLLQAQKNLLQAVKSFKRVVKV